MVWDAEGLWVTLIITGGGCAILFLLAMKLVFRPTDLLEARILRPNHIKSDKEGRMWLGEPTTTKSDVKAWKGAHPKPSALFSLPPLRRLLQLGEEEVHDTYDGVTPKGVADNAKPLNSDHSSESDADQKEGDKVSLLGRLGAKAIKIAMPNHAKAPPPPLSATLTHDPKIDVVLFITKLAFVLLGVGTSVSTLWIVVVAATDTYLSDYFVEIDNFKCKDIYNETGCSNNIHCEWIWYPPADGNATSTTLAPFLTTTATDITSASPATLINATTTSTTNPPVLGYCNPVVLDGLYSLSIQNIDPNDKWRWYIVASLASLFAVIYGCIMRVATRSAKGYVRRVMRLQARHALGYRTVIIKGLPKSLVANEEAFQKQFLTFEGLASPDSFLKALRSKVTTRIVNKVSKGISTSPLIGSSDSNNAALRSLTVKMRRPILSGILKVAVEVPLRELRLFRKNSSAPNCRTDANSPDRKSTTAPPREGSIPTGGPVFNDATGVAAAKTLVESNPTDVQAATNILAALPTVTPISAAVTTMRFRAIPLGAEFAFTRYEEALKDLQEAEAEEHHYHSDYIREKAGKEKKNNAKGTRVEDKKEGTLRPSDVEGNERSAPKPSYKDYPHNRASPGGTSTEASPKAPSAQGDYSDAPNNVDTSEFFTDTVEMPVSDEERVDTRNQHGNIQASSLQRPMTPLKGFSSFPICCKRVAVVEEKREAFRKRAADLSEELTEMEADKGWARPDKKSKDAYHGSVVIIFADAACALEYCEIVRCRYGGGARSVLSEVTVDIAGPPVELNRSTLSVNPVVARTVFAICLSIFVWLVFFYAVPVAILGSLTSLSQVPGGVGGVFKTIIFDMPITLRGVLTSYLPLVALAIFNLFLPLFVRFTVVSSGTANAELTDYWQFLLMFLFLFLNSVVFQAVLQGGLSQLAATIREPSWHTVSSMLVAMVSPSGGYWYALAFGGYLGMGMVAINISSLLPARLLSKALPNTQEQYDEYFERSAPSPHMLTPKLLVILGVGILFHATAPLLAFICGVFFLISYLVLRGSYMDIYQPNMDPTRQRVSGFEILRSAMRCLSVMYLIAAAGLLFAFLVKSVWGPAVIVGVICLPIGAATTLNVLASSASWAPTVAVFNKWASEDEANGLSVAIQPPQLPPSIAQLGTSAQSASPPQESLYHNEPSVSEPALSSDAAIRGTMLPFKDSDVTKVPHEDEDPESPPPAEIFVASGIYERDDIGDSTDPHQLGPKPNAKVMINKSDGSESVYLPDLNDTFMARSVSPQFSQSSFNPKRNKVAADSTEASPAEIQLTMDRERSDWDGPSTQGRAIVGAGNFSFFDTTINLVGTSSKVMQIDKMDGGESMCFSVKALSFATGGGKGTDGNSGKSNFSPVSANLSPNLTSASNLLGNGTFLLGATTENTNAVAMDPYAFWEHLFANFDDKPWDYYSKLERLLMFGPHQPTKAPSVQYNSSSLPQPAAVNISAEYHPLLATTVEEEIDRAHHRNYTIARYWHGDAVVDLVGTVAHDENSPNQSSILSQSLQPAPIQLEAEEERDDCGARPNPNMAATWKSSSPMADGLGSSANATFLNNNFSVNFSRTPAVGNASEGKRSAFLQALGNVGSFAKNQKARQQTTEAKNPRGIRKQ